MAVPIFMALSGYVYTKSFLRKNIDSMEAAYNPVKIVERILRFTVPYLLCFGVEVILDVLCEPRETIFNMLARFLRGGYGPGSYYYPVMIQFIFIFPLIFFLIKRYQKKGLIICGIGNLIYEILIVAYMFSQESYRLLVFRYIFIIAYGCYLGIENREHNWLWELIACLVGFTFIVGYSYYGVRLPFFVFWTGTSCVAAFYILPLIRYVVQRMTFSFPVFSVLGRASFNIFLVQMAYYAFVDMFGVTVGIPLVDLGIVAIVCCCIGVLFYRVTEFIQIPIKKILLKI